MSLVIVGKGGFGQEVAAYLATEGFTTFRWADDNDPTADYRINDYFDEAVVAIGSPATRQAISEVLRVRGAKLPNLTFMYAINRATLPENGGCVVCPMCLISAPSARIGIGLQMNAQCMISHDCVIGDYVTMSPGVRIMGNVKVGNRVFFGVGASVIPGITIGDGAIIGAGAVVTAHVDPFTTVTGVPARKRPS